MRPHITYANVVSTVCLFLMLTGGAAYAANTVFSSDIVDDQVRSVDVRDDTLAGGGLTAADLRAGSVGSSEADGLRGADIAESTLGQVPDADKLDSLDSTQLNPVTGDGRIADLSLNNGNQIVLTATITTVRSAALDVSATVDVANTQTNTGGVTCYFVFDGFAQQQPGVHHLRRKSQGDAPAGVGPGCRGRDAHCRPALPRRYIPLCRQRRDECVGPPLATHHPVAAANSGERASADSRSSRTQPAVGTAWVRNGCLSDPEGPRLTRSLGGRLRGPVSGEHRVELVLCPVLAEQRGAAGEPAPQRPRFFVGAEDLGQKPGRQRLAERSGVDLVGLPLASAIARTLRVLAITTRPTCGSSTRAI